MSPLHRRLTEGFLENPVRHAIWLALAIALLTAILVVTLSRSAAAQDGMQRGEAFLTRFSGTVVQDGRTVIDPAGTVGSIVDIRQPGGPPRGEHWFNEPQRLPVTAAQVGQVFGVAIDEAATPNIYLTATSAFGLHRNADNTGWMTGMWGPGGGPGTVWRLNAANNYQPEVFAQITLDGRANSGAALGNIAFDRWNEQFYVSDLETGMIHRLQLSDGADLGIYDHGVTGRSNFFDAAAGATRSLPPIGFDTATSARVGDCPSGDFARTPSCWNPADFRRRVWGLGVRRDPFTGEVRLFYATWGSQGFGSPEHAASGDDRRNAVWSVGITQQGDFDTASVRREFFLPDFFRSPEAIARAGFSHPVSDIAFPAFGSQDVMLLAERGGLRNRGLDAENAFAAPNESRVLRYELNDRGVWEARGRYDVGFYDRAEEGPPYLRAGSAGGVAFGMGYGENWEVDTARVNAFAWMTGDGLCSPRGLCFDSSANEHNDSSEVHGMQGRAEGTFEELEPAAAFQPYPTPGPATPATGPDSAFMIDADVNADASGNAIEEQLRRNDATRVGDIEIFQTAPVMAQRPEEGPWYGPWQEDWPWPIPEGDYPPFPGGQWPELALDKTGPGECNWDSLCTFNIRVTNNGPGVYTGPLHVLDTPPRMELEGFSGGWTCEQPVAGGAIGCRHEPVTLAPGASRLLTLTLRTHLPMPVPAEDTTVTNCAFIVWPGALEGVARNRAIEAALLLQGYVVGPVDGILDPASQAAIEAFRAAHGLPPGGGADEAFMQALLPGTSGMPGDGTPGNDWDCASVTIPGTGAEPPADGEPEAVRVDLAVEKARVDNCWQPDGSVYRYCDFDIDITNSSRIDFRGPLSFTDQLGDGTWLNRDDDTLGHGWSCGPRGTSGALITCEVAEIALAAEGGQTQVRLRIGIHPPVDFAVLEDNCAELTVPVDDPNGNNRDCAPFTGEEAVQVDLGIEKVASERCYSADGFFHCNFLVRVTNNGTETFTEPVGFTDQLTGGARLERFETWADGFACDPVGAADALITCRSDNDIEPGVGNRLTVLLVVAVPIPPGSEDLPEMADNCAVLDPALHGDDPDTAEGPNRDCASFVAERAESVAIDLGVTKTGPETCVAGSECGPFGVLIRNHSDDTWTGTYTLTEYAGAVAEGYDGSEIGDADRVSPGAIRAVREPEECSASANALECHYRDSIVVEDGASFYVTIPEDFPEGQVLRNCASISEMDPEEAGPQPNTACVNVRVIPPGPVDWGPAVSLRPGSETECKRGENCTLDVWIENTGKEPFVGDAGLAGTLSPAVQIVSVKGEVAGISCKVTGNGAYQCQGKGLSIKPGKDNAAHMTVVVAIPADFPHDEISHTKFMLWPDPEVKDKTPGDDRHVSTITIVGPKPPAPQAAPDLAVSKSANLASCAAGQPCGFKAAITNSGSGAYTGPLTVSDVITPANSRLTYSVRPPWSCRTVRGRTTCTHPSTTLAPGASLPLSLTFTTSATASGTVQNCAAITWPSTARVTAVQSVLNRLGFNAGKPDGKAGRQTRKAVRDYQKSVNMPASGRIDDALLRRLFGSWGEGDANAANDRDCATVPLTAAQIPPAVLPAPECPAGWYEISASEAKARQGKRLPTQRVTRGNRSIWCGLPVQTPPSAQPTPPPAAVACPPCYVRNKKGQCVSVFQCHGGAKRMTGRGPTGLPTYGCFCPSTRPNKSRINACTFACKPQQPTGPTPQTLSCPPGYKAYPPQLKNRIPRNSHIIRKQSGNRVLFCAKPLAGQTGPTQTPSQPLVTPSPGQGKKPPPTVIPLLKKIPGLQ